MTMTRQDVEILVRMLRAFRGCTQSKLASKAGLDRSSIVRYESGKVLPPPPTRKRLIAGAGIPLDIAEAFLPPVIRLVRSVMRPAGGGEPAVPPAGPESEVALDEAGFIADLETASRAALSILAGALAVHDPGAGSAGSALAEGRATALPTLAERLCSASVRAAADKPADAVELATMAVREAVRAAGGEAWRKRLHGWARAFLGNALRVAGNFRGAEVEFREAWKLWHAGREGDPLGLLPEWRLLDLEASLRREQLRIPEALALLERARRAAPPEAAARLLLSTACTLEEAGDYAGAVGTLREAASALGESGEARERFGIAFNLTANLCHLGRCEEAREGLAEVRRLEKGLSNELDSVRVVWLSARVNLGLGRAEKARAELEKVRDHFAGIRHGIATAVVSLELAAIDLEAGRTAEVRALAQGMAWIFSTEGLDRDALAALRLFCDAAVQEKATSAQARQLLASLERPHHLRRQRV